MSFDDISSILGTTITRAEYQTGSDCFWGIQKTVKLHVFDNLHILSKIYVFNAVSFLTPEMSPEQLATVAAWHWLTITSDVVPMRCACRALKCLESHWQETQSEGGIIKNGGVRVIRPRNVVLGGGTGLCID